MAAPLSIARTGATELALLPANGQPARLHHRRRQHGQDRDVCKDLSDEFSHSSVPTGLSGGRHEDLVNAFARSAARSVGSAVARETARGVMGSSLDGRR